MSKLRQPMLAVAFACALLTPVCSLGQSTGELQGLIFEPFPLPASGQQLTGAAGTTATAVALPGDEDGSAPSDEVLALLNADIARYEDSIAELTTSESPYSPVLREQYAALGQLLQRTGDHEGSIKALESAMHIDRVNEGLFTVGQIPLVESIIVSHTATGNFSAVDDYHEYLHYIQLKSYPEGDPRLLAAKERWADWNVEAYLRQGGPRSAGLSSFAGATDYVAIQNPRNGSFSYVPRNQLPNVLNPYNFPGNTANGDLYQRSMSYAVSPEQVVDQRLRKARDLYEEIREERVVVEDGAGQDHTVEHKLANIAYAVKMQMDWIESATDTGSLGFNRVAQPRTSNQVVNRGYTKSRDNFEAIAEELEQDPDSNPVDRANAWLHLGDWHIAFGYTARAEQAYVKAWETLTAAGSDTAFISRVLAPAPLLPVPAFAIHPYSRRLQGIADDAVLDYKGYLDVTLSINRNGSISAPRIDETSQEASQQLRSNLLEFLRETRVRPLLEEGKPITTKELKLRYYYTY